MGDQAEHSAAVELFNTVFEQDAMGMALRAVDPHHSRWLRVNQKFCDMLGYTREELLQLTSVEISVPGERHLAVNYNEQLLRGDFRSYSREKRYLRKNGTVIWTQIWLSAVLDPDGNPTQIISVIQDITGRKQAEEELRKAHDDLEIRVEERTAELQESEARIQDIATAATDRFWEMDENLRFTSMFDHPSSTVFLSTKNFIGRTRWEIAGVDPNKAEKWAKHRDDLLARRPFRDFQFAIKDEDGVSRYLSVSGRPFFDEEGNFQGYWGSATDITERHRAEEAVVSSKRDAEYANYVKTQFLANMSHELRTPLNSIIGFSQILMGQGMGKLNFSETSEYATNINDSANHLLSVIQDILDVSKIEAGELGLDKETVDFQKLIRDCMTMMKERADNEGVELSYKIADSVPSIEADEVRLKQILLNLLSNAIKFTPEGGKVEVAVEASDGNAVLLKVDDTGIGIKKNDIPIILKPFGQVKDIFRRSHEGTGLGLSLAKSLAELHGGNLAIESEVGKGTTVVVQLPNGQA